MYYLLFYFARLGFYSLVFTSDSAIFEQHRTPTKVDVFFLLSAFMFAYSTKNVKALRQIRNFLVFIPLIAIGVSAIVFGYHYFLIGIEPPLSELVYANIDYIFVLSSITFSLYLPFEYCLTTNMNRSNKVLIFTILVFLLFVPQNILNNIIHVSIYSIPFLYLSIVTLINSYPKFFK